jgi:ABC-2 type transport system ATP-binding protein
MQQRLGLGVALLGDPELILLDEPTSALDPIGRTDVRAIVRAARDRGATVILNSHLLTEVEQVCDRIVILHQGRVVASGSMDDVVAVSGVRLRVTELDERGRQALARFGPVAVDGEWLTIRPLDRSRVPDVIDAIVTAGGRVHAVEPGRGSLEARFLELVIGTPSPPTAPDPGPTDEPAPEDGR